MPDTPQDSPSPAAWLRDDAPRLGPDDEFGVEPVVGRLVGLLRRAEPPFTLSLSGPWGLGKTTIAKELVHRLIAAGIPACSVDLWTEDVGQLRHTLVIEVAAAIDASVNKDAVRETVARNIDRITRIAESRQLPAEVAFGHNDIVSGAMPTWYVRLIGFALGSMATAMVLAMLLDRSLIPLVSAIFIPFATFVAVRSGLFVRITNRNEVEQPAEAHVALHKLFRGYVAAPTGKVEPVLVVVDNLDRLDAEDALAALREIRSFVEIDRSRCVFVIPVDRKAFIRELTKRLPGSAADYLEKFFNLDVALAQPETVDLRDWGRRLLGQVLDGEPVPASQFFEVAHQLIVAAKGSPRGVKRIVNGVSTRYRLLEPSRRSAFSLSQYVLIEGLVHRFPTALESISREPLRFAQTLEEMSSAQPPALADLAWLLPEDNKQTRSELHTYLLAFGKVTVAASAISELLSARSDRFWRGVPEPKRLLDALLAGSADRFRKAIRQLTAGDQDLALSRVAQWVGDQVRNGYTQDAISALNAAASVVPSDAKYLSSLRIDAQEALLSVAAADGLERLTDEAVSLVFGSSATDRRANALWNSAVKSLSAEELADEAQSRLMAVVITGARFASQDERRAAQVTLKDIPDELLEPLYDLKVVDLIDRDTSDYYAEALGGWDISAEDQDEFLLALERLETAIEVGWSNIELLGNAIARAAEQSRRVDQLTRPQRDFIERLTFAAGTTKTSGDTLATALVQREADQPWAIGTGISLTITDESRPTISAAVGAFLMSSDEFESLLITFRSELRENPYIDIEQALTRRWSASGDEPALQAALRFRRRAVTIDFGSILDAVADGPFSSRLNELLRHRSRLVPSELRDLVRSVSARLATLDPSHITTAEMDEALMSVAKLRISIQPLVSAIEQRSTSADQSELIALGRAARVIGEAHKRSAPALSSAIAGRSRELGFVPFTAADWIIGLGHAIGDNGALIRALANRIREPSTQWSNVESTLENVRTLLRDDGQIYCALVSRAANASVSCDDARLVLRIAKKWTKPVGDLLSTANSDLAQLRARCPELIRPIGSLRGRRRQTNTR
jgi:tetratricopeptide (TPR) repeat protein